MLKVIATKVRFVDNSAEVYKLISLHRFILSHHKIGNGKCSDIVS